MLCAFKGQQYYKRVKEEDVKQYNCGDTLYKTGGTVILKCSGGNGEERLVLQREGKHRTAYFLLDPFAWFEPDSSVQWYSPAFVTPPDTAGGKQGLWVYVRPYTEMKGNWVHSSGSSGFKFSVDSIPTGLNVAADPTATGIYFYEKGKVLKISEEQSEQAFFAYGKEGFYFIPGKGWLYEKKYKPDEIK